MIMKSIKTKLIAFLGLLLGIICVGLSVISFVNSSSALRSNLGKTLPKIAEQTASNIQGRIEGELNLLRVVSARPDIKDPNNSMENKMSILLDEVKRIGCTSIAIIDINGNSTITDGTTSNVKDRPYFKDALADKSSVSDPIVSRANGKVVV